MNNIVSMNRTITVDYLFENGNGFGLWESFFVFDRLGKVFIAQFGDDENVGFGIEDVMNLDDVLCVFELLKDSNFVLKQFFMELTLDELEVNQLDGNLLI